MHVTGELVKNPGQTNTESMVLQLGKLLPKEVRSPYTIFKDNYFTSIKLFQELCNRCVGACGTTRSNWSHDFPPIFQAVKEKFGQIRLSRFRVDKIY